MADSEQADGAAGGGEVAAPRGKLKLIIAAAAVLLIAGGAATWFFFLRSHGEEMHAEAPPPKPPVFVEVPDMMVNLVGLPGERVQYLKVKVVLEVREEKQVEAIKPAMPRVTDIFQTYLRELRPSDLNGSAGLFRLKEELTRRVNAALSPSPGNAVLFQGGVIQWAGGIRRSGRRPRKRLGRMSYPARWRCNGPPWLKTAAATSAAARTAANGCCRRRKSTTCSVFPPAKSISTTIPAFAPSSIRRWCPTSACRCSKSFSTGWCG